MTDARIAGLVVAAVLLLWTVSARRRSNLSRAEMFGWTAVSVVMAALSIFPPLAEPFRALLRLENRLFAVLVIAVVALLGLRMRDRAALARVEERFGELVRNIAAKDVLHVDEPETDAPMAAIVIPAYNEQEAIEGVLCDLPPEVAGLRVRPIVVVDGSEDDTEKVARRGGYDVAVHPVNRGQGDALRTGFRVALRKGAAVVVTMDADGQHSPDDLDALIKPIVVDEADYVQGSRFLGQYDDAGGAREAGIRLFSRVVNALGGAKITDCTNGFRAIRADHLATLRLEEDRFSAAEIIMESARNGLRMREVPVHIRSRSHGESKKPRRLGYPIGYLLVILKVWLR